jgi:7-cyano-7-deazaguanine synthase
MKKQAVLSLSGGMDSSTLLLHLLSAGYKVTALSFDYGQKHRVELERAQQLVHYINSQAEHEDEHYFTKVKHQIITLGGLSELLNSALVTGGKDVPEGHYEQDNMKATVVPNRNKIFSSIIQAVALSIATQNDEKRDVVIAMGIHAGDFSVYPDCREEFRNADYEAFRIGNWDSELVTYTTPYIDVTKFEILEDGLDCCKQLGLNFDEVYCRTNTSYKPIQFQTPIGPRWYSDYKSAASVERIEAFIKLGRPDPVLYADETGPVNWETAKAHVEKILAEHTS